jgi:hypothetical protein
MIILGNPKYRLISLAVTIVFFAIIYFAVIKPDNDTANNAIKTSEQQVQQAVNQASQSGSIPAGVKNLTSCIAAAGTNTGEIQACTAKFQP